MKQRPFCIAAAVTILLPLGAVSAAAETLAVFTKSAGNPIARATRAGAEQVAKANGFTVFHYIPTSADNPRQQAALVDEALAAKRDAFVFTPVDVKAIVPASLLLRQRRRSNPDRSRGGAPSDNAGWAVGPADSSTAVIAPLPPITGINAGKEAVDMIKAGDMLASGDYTVMIDGCLGAEIAI